MAKKPPHGMQTMIQKQHLFKLHNDINHTCMTAVISLPPPKQTGLAELLDCWPIHVFHCLLFRVPIY